MHAYMVTGETVGGGWHRETAQEPDEAASAAIMKLLLSPDPAGRQEGWERFLARYSSVLLKVAFDFSPSYDGGMDRYAFMLDELSRDRCRRLRAFATQSGARFPAWLVVVARRMCIDHHRRRYGRVPSRAGARVEEARRARRNLADLPGASDELDSCAASSATDPHLALVQAECRGAVARALTTLETRDLLLLELRFQGNCSAREIATALHIRTPFHVYRRLRVVCAALRERVGPAGLDAIRA